MIGIAFTGLVVLGLLGIGVGALVAPRASARQYGIVLDDARALAFIRAMGARDLVIGVLLVLLASTERRELLACGMVAAATIAVVDFVVVSVHQPPPRALSRLLHAGGAIGLLAVGVILASGR
jgi:Domain of unknown function (DUF4267)